MATRVLRVTIGAAAGRSFEIDREFVIGREGGDLTLDDPELSRRHVALRPVDQGIEVEDLGSRNGTFVDGQRISSPTTLTTSATVKFGSSEGAVEISLPQMTRAAHVPAPGAVVGTPDVTRQGEILQPDMTRQREIVQPDVTAQRPVADPNVTAQRPLADPDVTTRRPVQSAPPAGGPPPSSKPAEDGGGGPAGGKLPLLIGAALLAVIAVVAVILLSGGGDEVTKRKVGVTMDIAVVSEEDQRTSEMPPGKTPLKWTMEGRARGKPFGAGTVTVFVTLQPIPKPPPGTPAKKPPGGRPKGATVTPRFELRFPGGTVVATERVTSRRLTDSIVFNGTGRILDGTGDFANATGKFTVTGGRPKFDEPFESIKWVGSVEY